MKKILLNIIYLLTCMFSIQGQTLYGTTYKGGYEGRGTINKFIPATNDLTVFKSLEGVESDPFFANFIQAADGKLYGMTTFGGSSDSGAIFSFDPFSSIYTKLKDFDYTTGTIPYGSLIQANDGKLYGTTTNGGTTGFGGIFSFDPSNFAFSTLKDFNFDDGVLSYGSLMQASDGKLYGTLASGGSNFVGVIFSFDLSTSTYVKLKDFDMTIGAYPYGSLIQATDGKLYGITAQGGSNSYGVIYSFDPSTSTLTNLKDFDFTNGGYSNNGSLIQASDGKLYGMSYRGGGSDAGVIFSFDPPTSTYTNLKEFDITDGAYPYSSLIQASDGKLYGMTNAGGSSGYGVIFSYDFSAFTYTKLKDFDNTNGASPFGSLVQASDGKFYAMTHAGGNGNRGVIFCLDPTNSTYIKLKDFGTNGTGSNVSAGLVHASDGKLYGTAYSGGGNGYGVIFSVDPSTSTFTKLNDFDNTNGANPYGGLIQASDGKLYGMTTYGGSNNYGVIFSYDPSASTFTKLNDFDYDNGIIPYGSLMQAGDGKLYGMTTNGGSGYAGVIFSYDPSTSTYTKLHDFDYNNGGGYPNGNLIQLSDGKLYGMTTTGSNNAGSIFSFDPSSSTYTNLKDFYNFDGAYPYGSLMQASDGKFYGMTSQGGSSSQGVIFSYDPSASIYENLKNFDNTNGAYPYGSLMQASDGKLYGMTNAGGSNSAGVVFSFDPSTSIYTKLIDYNGANGANPSYGSAFIEVTTCTTDTTYYRDADGDDYGNPSDSVKACSQPKGYVTNNTDCDDTKKTVNPGAIEICSNGIDDNCNGQVDENCNTVPIVRINDVSVNETHGVAVLTVTLSHTSFKPVSILYYTKDGTAKSKGRFKDYQTKIGFLTIPPGVLTTTISIKIVTDNIAEPTEYFDVILFRSLNAIITDDDGRVFISDDRLITHSNTNFNGEKAILVNSFKLKVMPNPTVSQFNLTVESNNKIDKIDMRVINVEGKLIETRSNLIAGQTLKFGLNYKTGSYIIQAVQGKESRTSRVIKLPE